MGARSSASAGKAIPRTEQSFGRFTSKVRSISFIAAAARALWANKIAFELAERAGVSVRSAENYLAGDRDMNGNALVRLLQSDAGPDFLAAMIEALPPTRQAQWRREFERAAERAELRRRLADLDGD